MAAARRRADGGWLENRRGSWADVAEKIAQTGVYREVQLLPVTIQNVPGTTAKVARTLANAGINIEFFAPPEESGNQAVFAPASTAARRRVACRVQGRHSFGTWWPKAVAGVASR